jgi:predicted Zn-dependent protease with MMP-like domain
MQPEDPVHGSGPGRPVHRPDQPGGDRHRTRRDRHGRGLRGALAPKTVPLSMTRAERFDEIVLDAVDQIDHDLSLRGEDDLRGELARIELAVEDIPPLDDITRMLGPDADASDAALDVPVARTEPAAGGEPARLVIYRRPVELRALTPEDREDFVHEIAVDRLAELLGVPVERLDPTDE